MTMVNAFSRGAERLSARDAQLLARREAALGPAYRLFYANPLHVERAQGVWLFDAEGRKYLDAYNNVACVGHCRAEVVEAVARQSAVLNTHTRYLNERVVDYAERLLEKFPAELEHVIFTCTGSEANDLALRIARTATGNEGLIVTQNAYHGVTAAIAEASPSLGPANRIGKHVRLVAPPRPEAPEEFAAGVRAAIADLRQAGLAPAALLLDTIFSSDGIIAGSGDLLGDAVEAVKGAGGLFIADEVQAGFGRLGSLWGFSRHAVVPDLVTLGKPMGNGYPIAAVVGCAAPLAAFGARVRYFNTYGGNPVAAAAGMAVLDVIERENLVERAGATGAGLTRDIAELARNSDDLVEVRGAGLFIGVQVSGSPESSSRRAFQLVNTMRDSGVLISATGAHGNVLKIRPPLVFEREHAHLLVEALRDALQRSRE